MSDLAATRTIPESLVVDSTATASTVTLVLIFDASTFWARAAPVSTSCP